MRIGVLALQGDFEAHQRALSKLWIDSFQVRNQQDLERADGLIMPGGESTTMLKLLGDEELLEPLTAFAATRTILATCAGVILAARRVCSPEQASLDLLDLEVERNAYGRQLDSSIRRLEPGEEFAQRTAAGPLEAVFIRAPIIRSTGASVKVLIQDHDTPVLVESERVLAATFHPELTSDRRVHELFLNKVRDGSP